MEKLAYRLRCAGIDLAGVDEADREQGDRSPEFANALMNQSSESRKEAQNLTEREWDLVCEALEHYATCHKE
jgi:hypothetical protein